MADVVQYRMERMVNELDDLEKIGLFSRAEINEIVKQRRKFEYRLKRPSPLKQDFLSYIDYEKNLDSLRILRKKAKARELKKSGNKKMKNSLSDYSCLTRIFDIYRSVLVRYKGDINIWFQYLEFCKQRRNGKMKKVLAQVIRYHPKVPGVWIYAAAWEFDQNLNVKAARALMQNGLRVCPTSEDLWIEYLRMELTYINKLKARKVALGEDEGIPIRDHANDKDKDWKEENKDLFMSLDNNENEDSANVQNGESKDKVDVFQEQGLSILRAIYSAAVEAIPCDISLRKRFFKIMESIEEIRVEVLADMKRDFASEPEYWDWLARLEISGYNSGQEMDEKVIPSQVLKSIEVYEESLKVLASSTMFTLYINFLMDVTILNGEENDSVSHILTIFENADTMGCLTEEIACQHITVCLQLGKQDEARKLAEKFCTGKLSDVTQLWVLRVSLEIKFVTEKSTSPSMDDFLFIFELLKNVLVKKSISEAETLWLMALKFFANNKKYLGKLVAISMASLMQYGGSESEFSLSSAIVNIVLQEDGIEHARELYKRYLALPHPGLAIYKNCIEMELNCASLGDKDCLANARRLFQSAVATCDQDVSLWQDYYSMEIKMGTSETSNAVYWRARKTLKDADAFLSQICIK